MEIVSRERRMLLAPPYSDCHTFSAKQEQRFVEPNVLVIGRDQKSPTGRKSKIRKYLRPPFRHVFDVERIEEVRIRLPFFAGPDVPPGRVALRRVAKTVERPQARPDVAGNAH